MKLLVKKVEISSNSKPGQGRPPQTEATTTKRDRTQSGADEIPSGTKTRDTDGNTVRDEPPLQTDPGDLPSSSNTREDKPSSTDGNQEDEDTASSGDDADTSTIAPTMTDHDISSTAIDEIVSRTAQVGVSAGNTATNGLPSKTGTVSRPGRTTAMNHIETTGAPDIFANPSDKKQPSPKAESQALILCQPSPSVAHSRVRRQ